MAITAFYAALLGLFFVFLSFRVIDWRRLKSVELGHGEDSELLRRMRVHANFAEYVPFTLLLMAIAESMTAPRPLIHVVGLILIAGRLMHAYGLSQTPHIFRLRVGGMILTFTALALSAIICLSLSLPFLVA
ncbi:MAG: glutathione metabolism protein [Hyphomicrobium sp.]|nr:glutathione metabolism protein [Hyphomicrobium sp.]